MSRGSTGTSRLRAAALVLAAAASVLLSCGLWRGAKPAEPVAAPLSQPAPAPQPVEGPVPAIPPAAGDASISAVPAPGPGAETPSAAVPAAPQAPAGESGQHLETPPGPGTVPLPAESGPPAGTSEAETAPAPGPALPESLGAAESGETMAAPATGGRGKSVEGAARPRQEETGGPGGAAPQGPETRPGRVVIARLPDHLAFAQTGPYWTRGREELVYRVEFLGMTMGYARFSFQGKVLLGGREAYHLSVRAWTANVLALIYPINDTIDYYMDVRTLEPLRQEYTSGNRKKDDVMIYDQATGRIVYRYKESGEIRKQVNAVPNVYDPVTLAYFIRSRRPNGDEKGLNVYAGRKVWEISAKLLGVEKITTDGGEFDTTVIRPVIKRDGKVEDKGDLRMWMTRDERKIPVRVYAKFKKIRTWTLVGELMPERKGG